jgi:cyclase
MIRAATVSLAFALTLSTAAAAQQDLSAVQIRTETAAPGVAVLFGAGGNIAVSHGADGTIVVDDQFAPLTARIQAAIAALGAPPAKYLINTHWHFDHTGGNENFGGAGAVIMAHDHVRDRMATQQGGRFAAMPPSPAVALPVITWHDGIQLHMNGGIRTIHAPHAHTDGDSIVHFTSANVIHMGDLFFHQISLPFIDLDSGGNVRGLIAAADRVIAMSNDATVIIPGHGPLARKADLIAYRAMLAEVLAVVDREKAAGKTLEQIIAMRPAARWDVNPDAFIKGDAFVTAVWQSLEAGAHGHGAGHEHGGEQGGHSH